MSNTARRSPWRSRGNLRALERSPRTSTRASRRIRRSNLSYLPEIRALLALNAIRQRGAYKAISSYKLARSYDRACRPLALPMFIGPFYTIYVRGLAYLAAHQGAEAAVEFQKILDHRGIVVSDPIGALAHLQLGRASCCPAIPPKPGRLTRIPRALEGRRRGHPHPRAGPSRIRQAPLIGLGFDSEEKCPVITPPSRRSRSLPRSSTSAGIRLLVDHRAAGVAAAAEPHAQPCAGPARDPAQRVGAVVESRRCSADLAPPAAVLIGLLPGILAGTLVVSRVIRRG